MFSLFISTTGEGFFQTDRTLEGIIACYVCSVHYVDICPILVHFDQIVLPLLLYKCKDQSLVKGMQIEVRNVMQ